MRLCCFWITPFFSGRLSACLVCRKAHETWVWCMVMQAWVVFWLQFTGQFYEPMPVKSLDWARSANTLDLRVCLMLWLWWHQKWDVLFWYADEETKICFSASVGWSFYDILITFACTTCGLKILLEGCFVWYALGVKMQSEKLQTVGLQPLISLYKIYSRQRRKRYFPSAGCIAIPVEQRIKIAWGH